MVSKTKTLKITIEFELIADPSDKDELKQSVFDEIEYLIDKDELEYTIEDLDDEDY